MPTLTQAELEDLVDQNGIVGLTLDTTEFFHVGYSKSARLHALKSELIAPSHASSVAFIEE